METSQRNSLYSYLKKNKNIIFDFLQKWRTGGQISSCLRGGISGRGEDVERGYRRVNMVQILCTYKCK
jgi:ribosomal protein L32E